MDWVQKQLLGTISLSPTQSCIMFMSAFQNKNFLAYCLLPYPKNFKRIICDFLDAKCKYITQIKDEGFFCNILIYNDPASVLVYITVFLHLLLYFFGPPPLLVVKFV